MKLRGRSFVTVAFGGEHSRKFGGFLQALFACLRILGRQATKNRDNAPCRHRASYPFSVGGKNMPGRPGGAGCSEHIGIGALVGLPVLVPLEIGIGEFP